MFSPAVRDLLAAAEHAREGWDKEPAPQLYTEALDLVRDDEPARRSIRLLRGLALVELEDFEAAAQELGELLPNLEGREQLEALLGLGRASMWMERTDQAYAFAERSLELAERLGDDDALGPALALLSQTHGIRGQEGDLDRAVELGDRALETWTPGTRAIDLAAHSSLHALTHYWAGGYARAAELGRHARELGGDVHNPAALLDGGSTEGLALAALGRHAEAIELFDATIARARELDSIGGIAYALNCSTAPLRDVLDLAESRRRNEEAIELYRRAGFDSGVMQGEIDLIFTDLLEDEVARVERALPDLWERARHGTGWERWLAPGRLSVARAEMALRAKRPEAAVEGALEAIEIARPIGRLKYDVSARMVLGTALLELGRDQEAVAQLRTTVEGADRLGHPLTRWQARAALGRALYGVGEDEGAAAAYREAAEIIRGFASTLKPERADPLLASSPVREILRTG
ncbi:MAG: tetratricopeptide repeat protein [Actinobacteria bacterium]|nr:tetratricopeptide repeat protein [Actinomycetota bacterium]